MKEIEKEILSEVVLHYIEHLEPIGSVQLKELVAIELSSATIRNYFKKLVDAGLLTQLHSSGGRIPTEMALKKHWQESILFDEAIELDLDLIDKAAKKYGLFSLVQSRKGNRLLKTEAVGDHLLITFEDGATITAKSTVTQRLLNEFEGYDIADIIAISKSSQIESLFAPLWEIRKNSIYRFNAEALIGFASEHSWSEEEFELFYGGSLIDRMRAGIFYENYAPDGYAIMAQNAYSKRDPMLVVAFGPTSRNFGAFIDNITKEER